jgi:hypothetical protein
MIITTLISALFTQFGCYFGFCDIAGDYLFYCLSIYFKRILHIDNIRTLSENIQFICMSFRTADRRASFCPVSQRLQMNLIFFDIVRIFSLSRNVTKSKITSKLCKKSRNKRRYNHFFIMVEKY